MLGMKTLMLFLLLGVATVWSQESSPGQPTYFAALVMKGSKWTAERTPAMNRVSQEHRDWLHKMASEGKLALAGPFTDNGEFRGLYIFKLSSAQEIQALCDSAPAVRAGQIRVEIHPGWRIPSR